MRSTKLYTTNPKKSSLYAVMAIYRSVMQTLDFLNKIIVNVYLFKEIDFPPVLRLILPLLCLGVFRGKYSIGIKFELSVTWSRV